MSCPNKNSKEFKTLVEQTGSEQAAIYTWKVYGGKFPSNMNVDLGAALNKPAAATTNQVKMFTKRIQEYNNKNNTSHSLEAKPIIGSGGRFTINIKHNYISEQGLKKQEELFTKAGYKYNKPSNTTITGLQFQENRGAFDTLTKIIYGLTNPDVTTFPHELAHAWEKSLTDTERQQILDWAGHTTWTRETSEKFATGFELYLAEGNKTKNKALNSIFEKFAKWLANMYKDIKTRLGLELNDTMRGIYATMLNSEHVSPAVKTKVEEALVVQPQAPATTEDSTAPQELPTSYKVFEISEEYFVIEDNLGNVEKYGYFETRKEAESYVKQLTTVNQQEDDVVPVEKAIINIGSNLTKQELLDKLDTLSEDAYYTYLTEIGITDSRGFTEADIYNAYLAYNGVDILAEVVSQGIEIIKESTRGLTLDDISITNDGKNTVYTNNNVKNVVDVLDEQADGFYSTEFNDTEGDPQYLGATRKEAKQTILEFLSDDLLFIKFKEMLAGITPEQRTALLKDLGLPPNKKTPAREILTAFSTKYSKQTIDVTAKNTAENSYYRITVKDKDGKNAEVIAKLVKADTINELEDKFGNVYKKAVLDKNKSATEKEYKQQKELEKPTPLYNAGKSVVVKDPKTKQEYTAVIETIEITQTAKGFEVVYHFPDYSTANEKDIVNVAVDTETYDNNPDTEIGAEKDLTEKQQKYKNIVLTVSQHFSKIFGDQFVFVIRNDEKMDAPAKFENGKIIINLFYADTLSTRQMREAVAHEYMHPFVLALKLSNKPLYKSLLEEIKSQPTYTQRLAFIQGKYSPEEIEDEMLTRYLGQELNKAFDKNGALDNDYIIKNGIMQRVLIWLQEIVGYLTGKKKIKTLDQFIKDVNVDKNSKQDIVKRVVEEAGKKEDVKKLFTKNKLDKLSRKIPYILKNKEEFAEALQDKELFDTIIQSIENYQNTEVGYSDYTFVIDDFILNTVVFEKTANNKTIVRIQSSLADNPTNVAYIIKTVAKRSIQDAEELQNFEDLVNANFYSLADNKNAEKNMKVSQINPLFKLSDVSSLIVNQMMGNFDVTNDVGFKFTMDEMKAIKDLQAYMKVDPVRATQTRERIARKLAELDRLRKSGLESENINREYNYVNFLEKNPTLTNDLDFITSYVDTATNSIHGLYRKYNLLLEEIKNSKGGNDMNIIAKQYNVLTNLMGFYSEFEKLSHVTNFDLTNPEEAKLYASAQSAMRLYNAFLDKSQNTAIDIVIKWFEPRIKMYNDTMTAEGYTDPKYALTPEILRKYFMFGVGNDTNMITFFLGANVSSRDPINALFANTVDNEINKNHFFVTNSSLDIDAAYRTWSTEKGLTGIKAQEDYYKKHFLRKVKTVISKYNVDKDIYEDVPVEKWALHQEFYWDIYNQDLEEFKKGLPNATNSDEEQENRLKIQNWKIKQGYTLINGVAKLTNPKYVNNDYAEVKDDTLFSILEKNYNESNEMHGHNKLRFGIIPQQYDVNFQEKVLRTVKDLKDEKTLKEKWDYFIDRASDNIANTSSDNAFYSLDGSIKRRIKTSLTLLKDDVDISLNLPSLFVDFVQESNHYAVLKNTEYNAHLLMQLVKGNNFLRIKAREFAKQDQSSYRFSGKRIEQAKQRLKELDALIAKGGVVNPDEYDKVKELANKNPRFFNFFDNVAQRVTPANTNRNNELVISQIEDMYYNVPQEDILILKKYSGKKVADALSYYSSLTGIALNPLSAISNLTVGNVQMFIESHGGMHYSKKELLRAWASYNKNIPTYIADVKNPIRSKDTQLLLQLDAIQGEIRDNFGRRITGSIASKFFNPSSLFMLTKMGEHQIQTVNMKAMLLGKKVTTTAGETISLYDAYTADKNGRYSLRKDINFTEQDLLQFTSVLKSVNTALNGNYSDINKAELQRRWYGNAMLKFRKYLYSSFRTRWVGEHVDYQKNTPEVGYLNYFFTQYTVNGIKGLLKGSIDGFKTNTLQKHEIYAVRKAVAEVGLMAAITLVVPLLLGGEGDDDDKAELSLLQKILYYQLSRTRSDLATFSFASMHSNVFVEGKRQITNPTATLRGLDNIIDVFAQLGDIDETYTTNQGGHKKGDSKFQYKLGKLIPGNNLWRALFKDDLENQIDNRLSYEKMLNKRIDGVSEAKFK